MPPRRRVRRHRRIGAGAARRRSSPSPAAGARAGDPTLEQQAPVHEWRGLHVDLARQFLPAVDVEWLIDVAAWQRLNRLHLHLTDDEAWRVPIAAYPALTEVGAWRGHGLADPRPARIGRGSVRRRLHR